MNKTLVGLAALAIASATTASADKVGAYILGGQYTQQQGNGNAIRYGIGLPALGLFGGYGAVGISGDVSYLLPLNTTLGAAQTVVNDVNAVNAYNLYYGAELGLGVAIAGGGGAVAGGISVTPSALIGVEFNVADPFSVFLEGSLGYTVALGGSTAGGASAGGGFAPGIRLGVNYRLN